MFRMVAGKGGLFITTALIALSMPGVAMAQADAPAPQSSDDASSGEIIVTARLRAETAISTPVVVQGLTNQQLEDRGIDNLSDFSQSVPSLRLGEAAGATQGGVVSLRGIAAGDGNPFGDQAVAFVIDGVAVARSSVRRMSEYDLAQMEVLKGPQALYYGKNSPGGVIVLRTNDPTPEFSAGIKGGYEFNAHEVYGDAFISAPLGDSFGIRVAGAYSRMRGWVKNVATPDPVLGPHDRWLPGNEEYSGRLTLKYDDGGPFTARFKLSHSVKEWRGAGATAQRVFCPYGEPHYSTGTVNGQLVPTLFGGPDNCKADDEMVRADPGPSFNAKWDRVGDGIPTAKQKQTIGGLELNFDAGPILITSQTGYYKSRYRTMENLLEADTTLPALNWMSDVYLSIREFSQELRFATQFDGPINFLVGGHYQDADMSNSQTTQFNSNAPVLLFSNLSKQKGKAWSVFASATIDITPTIELSGGGRYSKEKKNFKVYNLVQNGVGNTDFEGPLFDPTSPCGTAVCQRKFDNFSPEITLAWRPTSKVTVFGGYRSGFLSGGFQTGSGPLQLDQSYDQEKVKGFEGGVKALLFGDALRINAAAYTYKVSGMQVSLTQGPAQFTTNAASARSKGFEIDANWKTPVEGLSLRGGIAYNKANYTDYVGAPCYTGQTVALGCTLQPSTASFGQDLSGKVIVRSPEWGATMGGTWTFAIADDTTLGFNADANYTTGFYAEGTNKPGSWQKGYWLLDASVYVEKGPVKLSLIGRNLTNTYYFDRTIDALFSGTSNADRTQGVLSDTLGSVSRGRQIAVQAGYKF